jgi:hypothetical protein
VVPTFRGLRNGQNIGNPRRIVPDSAVSPKFINKIRACDTRITVDVHRLGMLANICQEFLVAKDVNHGLVVKKNPILRELASTLNLHDNFVSHFSWLRVDELIMGIFVLVIEKISVICTLGK